MHRCLGQLVVVGLCVALEVSAPSPKRPLGLQLKTDSSRGAIGAVALRFSPAMAADALRGSAPGRRLDRLSDYYIFGVVSTIVSPSPLSPACSKGSVVLALLHPLSHPRARKSRRLRVPVPFRTHPSAIPFPCLSFCCSDFMYIHSPPPA